MVCFQLVALDMYRCQRLKHLLYVWEGFHQIWVKISVVLGMGSVRVYFAYEGGTGQGIWSPWPISLSLSAVWNCTSESGEGAVAILLLSNIIQNNVNL